MLISFSGAARVAFKVRDVAGEGRGVVAPKALGTGRGQDVPADILRPDLYMPDTRCCPIFIR